MTQASLPKGSSQDDQSSKPINVACGPSDSLRPTSENPSDNETSERPVREKLKKTSIASISQHAKKAQHGVLTTEESDVANFASAQKEALPEVGSGEAADDSIRGRPVKKRSFDDLEAAENDGDSAAVNGGQIERTNGHARKRSRDVRTNETVKADRQLRTFDPTVEEEGEDSSSRTELPDTQATALEEAEPNIDASSEITHQMEVEHDLNTGEHGGKAEEVFLETGTDHSDREMPDPAASPRKKRSRDQFDTEVDREQKIPATEEAKAQRRSVELERTETTKGRDENAAAPEVSLPSENVSTSRMANSTTGTEHGLETGKVYFNQINSMS